MYKLKKLNAMRAISFISFFLFVVSSNTIIFGQVNRCPIVIGPRGAQLIVSFESGKKICNNRVKYVSILKTAISPKIGQDLYKNIYEATKSDSIILVSKASDKYFSAPDGGIPFLMFKGIGVSSYWLGLEEYNGKYYTLINDTILKVIGYQEKKYRNTPDGNKILMTKGIGTNEFFVGSSNGKIYKAKGDDLVEQIGVYDYFWLPPLEGSKVQRAIVMTKGMGPNDKWCGEMDGIIYIEK